MRPSEQERRDDDGRPSGELRAQSGIEPAAHHQLFHGSRENNALESVEEDVSQTGCRKGLLIPRHEMAGDQAKTQIER